MRLANRLEELLILDAESFKVFVTLELFQDLAIRKKTTSVTNSGDVQEKLLAVSQIIFKRRRSISRIKYVNKKHF